MSRFKEIIGLLLIPVEYSLDFVRALMWSKASPLSPQDKKLHYEIVLLAHTVEKGLSMPEPRAGFGQEKITKLLGYLGSYEDHFQRFAVEKAYGCLAEYLEWHAEIGYPLGDFGTGIQSFVDTCKEKGLKRKGGSKSIRNSSVEAQESLEFALLNRFSCRSYQDRIVTPELIDRIAQMVARTPSQCNRQSSRVHYFSDPEKIDNLLRLQGGAEGFRETVRNLFIVTSEITAWSGLKARSQAYVDGALTSMQLLNACQSLGLGACPLNMAVTNSRELKICNVGGIPKGERIIMMISFGHPKPTDLKVARSERLSSDEVMICH
ncbi:nitroreductase family protein [Agarivorans sp. TSD2052]|uniref:nitroreductase family protein n=1 Tax=Agarivorans sp. TSD2052 TaxID=2937286 RepID=UPI00200C51EA|nr:nitroreductase family protein [Agarivorans sp. TSD2052]UPW18267.1 nitroreductase family protein [Agarivorans sp. TSD2052]